MPPKKPAKKAAAKPAKKLAVKKPAAKKPAVKAAKKPAPKAAPKPASKPATKPAAVRAPGLWQPAAKAAPARPTALHIPPTPAPARARGAMHAPSTLLKLTWSYLWRSWLLAIGWGAVATLITAMLVGRGGALASNPAFAYVGNGVDILVSIALSVCVMWWLLSSKSLMASFRLRTIGPVTFGKVFGLWFSFTWRSIAFAILGLIGAGAMAVCVGVAKGVFPPLATALGILFICVGFTYFFVGVPYISWMLLLRKKIFGWGTLELTPLKD